MKKIPSFIYFECTLCGEPFPHEVLKGRNIRKGDQSFLDCTIKCNGCNFVHKECIPSLKELTVPLIISDGKESLQTSIRLESEDSLNIGDQLIWDEYPVKITRLELDHQHSVEKCKANQVQTIWSKRYDRVKLGVSLNRGQKTTSMYFWCEPDCEMSVGDNINIDGMDITIIKIKVKKDGKPREGAMAGEIARLYGRNKI